MAKITDEIIREALDCVSAGDSMKATCERMGVDRRNLMRKIREDEHWNEQYHEARGAQADAHADEIMECARRVMRGELGAQEGRVAIDAYKWTAAKLKPQSYGDRMEYNIKGEVNLTAILERFDKPMIDVTPERPLVEG